MNSAYNTINNDTTNNNTTFDNSSLMIGQQYLCGIAKCNIKDKRFGFFCI